MVKEAVKKIDTTESPEDSQVRGWYKQLMASVYEIDDTLDAQTDAGGTRKFTNAIVDQTKSGWEPVAQDLIKQMSEMTEEELAGSFYGIVRDLSAAYKESIDAWIKQQIDALPKPETEEKMSDEEKKKLQETRQELNKKIRAIIEMAYTFGEASGNMNAETVGGEDGQDPNWPFPKVRRGSVGTRGPRALSLYTWTIDGEGLEEDDDSVKGVATKLGYEKVAEFTKALREDPEPKINTTTPPETFTKELKGKVVVGKRLADSEDEEEQEEDPTEPAVDSEEE